MAWVNAPKNKIPVDDLVIVTALQVIWGQGFAGREEERCWIIIIIYFIYININTP